MSTPQLSYDEGTRNDAAEVRRFAAHMRFELPDNMDGGQHPAAQCMAAAIMEIIRLREDKARLDLLDRNAQLRERTLAIMERGTDLEPIRWAGIEWDGLETTVRVAIDFHRNR